MIYTSVFATNDEIERMKHAVSMPFIKIGDRWPKSAQEVAHEFALKHGLPEIPGYYGCDLRTGEFISGSCLKKAEG